MTISLMSYLSGRSLPYAWPSSRVILLQIPLCRKWLISFQMAGRIPPDIKAYFPIRDHSIVDNGAILKGLRVVIPNSLRREYIQPLHKGHPGADATKRRARDIVYWPSMMLEIDSTIASCQHSNSARPHQQKEPLLVQPSSGASVVPC